MQPNPASAYGSPAGAHTPARSSQATASLAQDTPALLMAVGREDAERFAMPQCRRLLVDSTADAVARITRDRPRIVVVDWDLPSLDAAQVCQVAATSAGTSVLVATATIEKVPAILRAGCHAVLLKPFPPNLFATRVGRLLRDRPTPPRGGASHDAGGTNRFWATTACPQCHIVGVTSFDFFSYRRMWYACLSCDAVWLGPRQE